MQLSDREKKVVAVLVAAGNCLRLDTIAYRLGYKPPKRGRLAVLKTLRSILHREGYTCGLYGEENGVIGRLPPKDQWGAEYWFATPKAKALVQSTQNKD